MKMQFRDRHEAGELLAEKLATYANKPDVIVLALPRGGVPVGAEVARKLNAPFDVFLVRKLGLPGHPELAMGVIASGGVRVPERVLQHFEQFGSGKTPMKKLFLSVGLLVALNSLSAQAPPSAVVKPLPPQSTAIQDVVVPVPREVFETLDRFTHSNWRLVQRPEIAQQRPPANQVETALLLGAVIAEGFVAVEAHDPVEVKSLGRTVLKLARGLGVEKAALRRSRSIVEHADRGDWSGVRKEWDAVLPDVQQGMNALRSEQLAQLVSLGGWLRGTEALTALILQNYSTQDAELLRQPGLLDHFDKRLAGMSNDLRADPMIVRTRQAIQKIRPLITTKDAPISAENVRKIATISGDLLKTLNR